MPGLILAIVVGGSAAAAAAITLLSPGIAAPASIAAGLVLMGWIVGEFLILGMPSWIEGLYLLAGAAMTILGFVATRPPAVT